MPRMSRSVRLLPVMLITAVLLLTSKLFDVAHGVDGLLSGDLPVGVAHASGAAKTEKPAEKPAHGEAKPAETKPAEAKHGDGKADEHKSEDPKSGEPKPAVRPAECKPPVDQPPPPTPQEMQVLQALVQRREALDQRAQELDRRADLLQAADATLDRKLGEMKELEATLVSLIKTHDEQQDAKLRSLVKIYENMKPKDASRIFEELDMETLLPVVEQMSERKLAPVMADMNPVKAKTITQELSRLRQLAAKNRPAKSG